MNFIVEPMNFDKNMNPQNDCPIRCIEVVCPKHSFDWCGGAGLCFNLCSTECYFHNCNQRNGDSPENI